MWHQEQPAPDKSLAVQGQHAVTPHWDVETPSGAHPQWWDITFGVIGWREKSQIHQASSTNSVFYCLELLFMGV